MQFSKRPKINFNRYRTSRRDFYFKKTGSISKILTPETKAKLKIILKSRAFRLLLLCLFIFSFIFNLSVHITKKENQKLADNKKILTATQGNFKKYPIYVHLQDAGVEEPLLSDVIRTIPKQLDFRKLNDQDNFKISTDANGNFLILVITKDLKRYYVANIDGVLVSGISDIILKKRMRTAQGTIKDALFLSMMEKNINPQLIIDLAYVFSWNIDFHTETRNGDEYSIVWEEEYFNENDQEKITKQLILGAYYNGKFVGENTAILFDGDYYEKDGTILRKMFLRSPIKFGNFRISSGFSYSRRHPILRIRRPHLGIDYAAPRGTPVQVVADGKITKIGRNGGFGNYIEVKHANGYATTYGHLYKYASGMKRGKRVKQGKIIAYVGSTGLSSGPHLDFRIKRNGKHFDFLRMKNKTISTKKLSKEKMAEFEVLAKDYLKKLNIDDEQK